MVTITKQPSANSIILDSDLLEVRARTDEPNTLLEFQVTVKGEVHRFYAPKYDDYHAVFQLQNYFRNYVVSESVQALSSIYKLDNLFNISARFYEHRFQEGVSFKELNPFKILFSTQNLEHPRNEDLYFLGIAESLQCSLNPMLSIPFFVKNNSVLITIVDQDNVLLHSESSTVLDGYCIFRKKVVLKPGSEYIVVKISTATKSIFKYIRVVKNSLFKPLEVRFVNQFGATIYSELFGGMEIKDSFKYENYKNRKGVITTADVEVEGAISVDTGYLLQEELFLIDQLLTSLKVEIKIKDKWVLATATTKNITIMVSNEWLTSNELTFKYNRYAAD